MKLRIKFAKYGALKFVGHLDMMRYFQKAIRRAEIDVAYTGGFSPHQVMSFAAPLGVGLESHGEYFDIEVHSFSDVSQVANDLNKAMVPGVEILRVTLLPEDAGNAMASVAAAEYEVRFRPGHEPDFDWISQFGSFVNDPVMPVIKKTKKSELALDIKPYIYSLSVSENGIIHMKVDASSSGNIKPGLVVEAFMAKQKKHLLEFDLEITRLETYRQNGEELVPMDSF